MKIIKLSILLFIISSFTLHKNTFSQENEILTIYAEPFEPFIIEKNTELNGPYIDAFKKISLLNNIKYKLINVPIRRAINEVRNKKNICVFAANYSPEMAETALYVSKLSKMEIWAFSLKSKKNIKIRKISDLKKYHVGAIDISEIRDILSLNGINYTSIFHSSSGLKMLISNRFDVLISDINIDIQYKNDSQKIKKLIPIISVEKWLICNQNSDITLIKKLKTAFVGGLFSDSVREIWNKYGLINFYNNSRSNKN